MQCPRCDHANPIDARFCSTCGGMLSSSTANETQRSTFVQPPFPTAPGSPTIPLAGPMPTARVPSMYEAAAIAPLAPSSSVVAPINVNVTVQAPTAPVAASPVVVVAPQATGPGFLARGLYFLFIGLWLGAFWTVLAWFLLVSIIGLPLGLFMLNRLPQVMTLKPIRTHTHVTVQGNAVIVGQSALPQRSFLVRAIYFVLIGWWFSALWLGTAWSLIGVTFGLALPLSFWMFDQTPAIVSLARQ